MIGFLSQLLLCFVCKTLTSTTCAESLAQRHPFCTQKSFFSPLLGRQNSLLPQKRDFPCSWEWPRDLLQYRILPSVRLFPGPQGAPEAAALSAASALLQRLLYDVAPALAAWAVQQTQHMVFLLHGFTKGMFCYWRSCPWFLLSPTRSTFLLSVCLCHIWIVVSLTYFGTLPKGVTDTLHKAIEHKYGMTTIKLMAQMAAKWLTGR